MAIQKTMTIEEIERGDPFLTHLIANKAQQVADRNRRIFIYADETRNIYGWQEFTGARKMTILEAIDELRDSPRSRWHETGSLYRERLDLAEERVRRGELDAESFILFMNERYVESGPPVNCAAIGCGCGAPEPHVPGGIHCRRGA